MSCRSSPVVVMATWLALSGGIWVKGRRVVAACCRFWALFRLDFFIVTRLLKGSIVLAIPLVSMLPRAHGQGEYTWHGLRSSMGISSCRDDTLGRAAKAHPPLLADRRRRIVYGRGIPYGERPHAFKESAPWQARNVQHGVHSASCPPHRVYLSL